ncbi:MAG: glycosyltransferase family 2 protein [Methanoregula sp.]|uniref:glycosyltransferase family 2 protein n=1 Tax=Methanoregula sp. TaxID=2052170 RepID=UPI003D0FCA72
MNPSQYPGMSYPPLISVVIVNFNGQRFLSDCFSSLFRETYPKFEVILIDNASRDGSVEFVREKFPDVKIFVQKSNLGFAGGANSGIRKAQGEFIFTLNNDTMVSAGCLDELIKPMMEDPGVGVCASKMVFPDGRINSTAICISRSGAAWDRGIFEEDHGQYDRKEEVFGACAGAALYRKAMLDQIGLFDEDFFAYMEDVDLAFRARLSGWTCIYVPTATIIHKHGGTSGFNSDLSIYYRNRNVVWTVVKNFPVKMLIAYLPWIVGRNISIIPYYVMQGKSLTILKSKMDLILGINKMMKKRRTIMMAVSDDKIKKWISPRAKIPLERKPKKRNIS